MESFPTNLSSTHIFLCAVAIGSLQSLRPNAAAYFIILAAHASIILLPSYSVWTPVQSNVSKCRPVRCRPTAGLFNVPVTTNHLPFRPHTFLSILVHHCCWWISYPIRYIYLHIDIHMDQNLYKQLQTFSFMYVVQVLTSVILGQHSYSARSSACMMINQA